MSKPKELTIEDCDPCPRCGDAPALSHCYAYYVACDNCYDGPDEGGTETGGGLTKREAYEGWNEAVEMYVDEHGEYKA